MDSVAITAEQSFRYIHRIQHDINMSISKINHYMLGLYKSCHVRSFIKLSDLFSGGTKK